MTGPQEEEVEESIGVNSLQEEEVLTSTLLFGKKSSPVQKKFRDFYENSCFRPAEPPHKPLPEVSLSFVSDYECLHTQASFVRASPLFATPDGAQSLAGVQSLAGNVLGNGQRGVEQNEK